MEATWNLAWAVGVALFYVALTAFLMRRAPLPRETRTVRLIGHWITAYAGIYGWVEVEDLTTRGRETFRYSPEQWSGIGFPTGWSNLRNGAAYRCTILGVPHSWLGRSIIRMEIL